jgi:hypothetical protein
MITPLPTAAIAAANHLCRSCNPRLNEPEAPAREPSPESRALISGAILARDDAAYFALSDFEMRLLAQADVHVEAGVATLVPEAIAEALGVIREHLVLAGRNPSWRDPTARGVIDGYSMLADRGLLLMSVIGVPGSLFVLVAPIGHQLDLVRRSADLVNLPAA